MISDIEVIKFIEDCLGIKLLAYQKELLKLIVNKPDNQLYLAMPPRVGYTNLRRLFDEWKKSNVLKN